jgi:uncharacterized membrane protein YphA (DoxX/SURF4 family)
MFDGNAAENITIGIQSKGLIEFVVGTREPKVSRRPYSEHLKRRLTMQEIGTLTLQQEMETLPAQQRGEGEAILLTFFGVSLAALSIYLFDTNSPFPLTEFLGFDLAIWDVIACVVSVVIGLILTAYWQRKQLRSADRETYLYRAQVILRYFLAYIFLLYGFAKIFKGQFYSFSSTLDTPLGDISGLQLTWRFFGYSYAYTVFVAASQIIGSTLLLFKRTTTLGAVILLPVIANIVFVNFTHSIPVKLYSSFYLIMLGYLLFADFKRLKALFWDNLPVARRELPVFTKTRRLLVAKYLSIFILFAVAIGDNYYAYTVYMKTTTPLQGVWAVQDYQVNDVSRAADSDSMVWKKVYFESDTFVAIKTNKPRPEVFFSTLDTEKRTIKLENPRTEALFAEGEYELQSEDRLLIKVANETETIRVILHKVR